MTAQDMRGHANASKGRGSQRLHFIWGLPRSGSTLLAVQLHQNPRIHAGISSPPAGLVGSLLADMSGRTAAAIKLSQGPSAAAAASPRAASAPRSSMATKPASGGTKVSACTLEIGDAGSPTAVIAGHVRVASGTTLGGHGSIGGNVTNNGAVMPGGSLGILTVMGNYTLVVDDRGGRGLARPWSVAAQARMAGYSRQPLPLRRRQRRAAVCLVTVEPCGRHEAASNHRLGAWEAAVAASGPLRAMLRQSPSATGESRFGIGPLRP